MPSGRTSDGSWTYRKSLLADRQLHDVLFGRDSDRLDLYTHEEYSWIRHPLKHALQQGIDRPAGVDTMQEFLDSADIDYHSKSYLP